MNKTALLTLPLRRVLNVKPLRAMTEAEVLALDIIPKLKDAHPFHKMLSASKVTASKVSEAMFTVVVEYC